MSAGRALVAGSGKMARNIGMHLLRCGWDVTWASRDPGRLADLERWAGRRSMSLGVGRSRAGFVLAGVPGMPEVDVLVESIEEEAGAKAALIEAIVGRAPGSPAVLTNSSSILPGDIHPACAGLHFFYPVEMTGLAELVMPGRAASRAGEAARRIAETCDLDLIVETEERAFAANRILLPLQAEASRATMSGCPAGEVDSWTRSDLMGTGVLALMDSVGLDVVLPAARNYVSRMGDREAAAHAPLVECLEILVRSGKLGSKNRDGFLAGRPLPFTGPRQPGGLDPSAFRHLFINSCASAVEKGLLDGSEIDLVLASLHGSVTTLRAAVDAACCEDLAGSLGSLYRSTGLCYFHPASCLQGGAR